LHGVAGVPLRAHRQFEWSSDECAWFAAAQPQDACLLGARENSHAFEVKLLQQSRLIVASSVALIAEPRADPKIWKHKPDDLYLTDWRGGLREGLPVRVGHPAAVNEQPLAFLGLEGLHDLYAWLTKMCAVVDEENVRIVESTLGANSSEGLRTRVPRLSSLGQGCLQFRFNGALFISTRKLPDAEAYEERTTGKQQASGNKR